MKLAPDTKRVGIDKLSDNGRRSRKEFDPALVREFHNPRWKFARASEAANPSMLVHHHSFPSIQDVENRLMGSPEPRRTFPNKWPLVTAHDPHFEAFQRGWHLANVSDTNTAHKGDWLWHRHILEIEGIQVVRVSERANRGNLKPWSETSFVLLSSNAVSFLAGLGGNQGRVSAFDGGGRGFLRLDNHVFGIIGRTAGVVKGQRDENHTDGGEKN
jgi:hypothetical protein